jgi:cellobiose epimerase
MKISIQFILIAFAIITGGCESQQQIPQEEKAQLIQLRDEIVADLTGNLLPFWKQYSVDPNDPKEGFYGAIAYNGEGISGAEKSNVLFARYLWTYSAASRVLNDEESLKLAHRAYNYLNNYFWDAKNGGVFWALNADGSVSDSTKMTYGQAFAIYAFSEYYRISENQESRDKAIEIYRLLEENANDNDYGGYLEAFTAGWEYVPGIGMAMGRSKSMNTHLHVLEAYTNLYRIWPDEELKEKLHLLIDIFRNHILNRNTGHQELYFERDWTVFGRYDSYGHDIEFSWLYDEAGKVLENPELLESIQEASVQIAKIQLEEGMNDSGAMIYEKEGEDHYNRNISWWVQAEAVVGFLNAYQLSGDKKYLDAATGVWNYIRENMVDETHGGWHPNLDENGNPKPKGVKGNSWTCPYHNARMGFEVYERLHNLN